MYVLLGFGTSLACVPIELTSQIAFKRNRALAGGLTFLGYSAGTAISSLLMAYFIENYGWRGSLLLLGGVLMHKIPIAMTIRVNKPPDQKSQTKSFTKELMDFKLYKIKRFALFCLGSVFHRASTMAFRDHNASRIIHLGSTIQQAAWLPFVTSISSTITRLLTSFGANLLAGTWRPFLFTIGSAMGTLSAVILVAVGGYTGAMVGSVFCGISTGEVTMSSRQSASLTKTANEWRMKCPTCSCFKSFF